MQEVTHADPTAKTKDWTGNAVPVFDSGAKTGKPPSVTLVYDHVRRQLRAVTLATSTSPRSRSLI